MAKFAVNPRTQVRIDNSLSWYMLVNSWQKQSLHWTQHSIHRYLQRVHGIAFYGILARACAEIKFRLFEYCFSPFLFLLFSPFAAVIDLLLGLLAVKKISKNSSSRPAVSTMEQPRVVAGNVAQSFSLNFLSIFVHISGSIRPITLIWVFLEKSFSPTAV